MRARLPAVALGLVLAAAPAGGTPAAATAGGGFTQLFHGTPHDAVFDVDIHGAAGWAVGAGGLVLVTSDGGATWTRQPAAADVALLGVAQGGGSVLAVGQGGLVLRRPADTGGGAWTPVASGTDQRLFAVDLGAGGQAVAVGAFGTVLRSTDAGRSWQAVALDWASMTPEGSEPHLYGVQVDGDRVVVVGEFGLVLRSADGGRSWTVAAQGDASLFDVVIGADGRGLAVGQKGVIARTADDGRTWTTDSVPSEALLGVWASGGKAFAAGIRSAFASRDGGRSWAPVDRGDIATGWYQAVGEGAGGLVLVGHGGRLVALDPFAAGAAGRARADTPAAGAPTENMSRREETQ